MNRNYVTSCLGLVALLVSSAPLDAQEEVRRRGFWVSFGIGAGVNTADVAPTERRGGLGGYVRAGGAPSGHVVLGTELMGWLPERDSVVTSRGNVTAFVQYYPSKTGGLFFKGGLGGAGLSVATPLNPGTLVTSTDGFGMTLGGGYEFRLSRIAALTINADWMYQALDDKSGGTDTTSLFLFTVGFTFPRIG